MRVLIVNPPWPGKGYGTRSQNRIIKHRSDKYLQYPIFLAYAAAQLRQAGHEVVYLDAVIQDLDMDRTEDAARRLAPDALFMETTTPSIAADYRSLTRLKQATTAAVIVGGPHATYFHRQVLEDCAAIDVVVRHEFDTKIVPVVSNLEDLAAVGGITYRHGDRIVDNGDGTMARDLDRLPFPDRDTVPWHWYVEAWYSRQPFMNLMTSRGCPYRCSFCLWPQSMYGHRQRTRSIDNVMEELHLLVRRYGLREVNIDDGTFTTRRERVMEFCRRLRAEGLDLVWTCNGRVDHVDDEMLAAMKAAGCKMIRLGIESGDPEVLARIHKNLTLEQIESGVRRVQRAGIQALGGFMFGFPYDSRRSVEATLALAKRLNPDQVQFSIAMCYPGTSLYEYARDNDLLLAKDFNEFDMTCGPVVKTRDMTREELQDILARAYREFYFRPRFILRTLRHLRDVDEIRRVLRSFRSLVRTILLHRRRAATGGGGQPSQPTSAGGAEG